MSENRPIYSREPSLIKARYDQRVSDVIRGSVIRHLRKPAAVSSGLLALDFLLPQSEYSPHIAALSVILGSAIVALSVPTAIEVAKLHKEYRQDLRRIQD